jgi:hypothetical protein
MFIAFVQRMKSLVILIYRDLIPIFYPARPASFPGPDRNWRGSVTMGGITMRLRTSFWPILKSWNNVSMKILAELILALKT